MKALIIEDDRDISTALARQLASSGIVCHTESDGTEGAFRAATEDYDVILLDLGLPGKDGHSVLRELRAGGCATPIIIITARGSKRDVVLGLDAGADDYITKPFDYGEVAARIRSNLRRAGLNSSVSPSYNNVSLDEAAACVVQQGVTVALTRTEYAIVRYLFRYQGKAIGITELGEHVYDDFVQESSVLQRHVANIRKKLGADFIHTESNRGYLIPNSEQTS